MYIDMISQQLSRMIREVEEAGPGKSYHHIPNPPTISFIPGIILSYLIHPLTPFPRGPGGGERILKKKESEGKEEEKKKKFRASVSKFSHTLPPGF